MPYSATTIANKFIELAKNNGKKLTNMQLQKLVYFAHGYSLGFFGAPLTYNNVHAFEWGPVFPTLYKKLSKYGKDPVDSFIKTDDPKIPEDDRSTLSILEGVWNAYGDKTAAQLSSLTHKPNTPWTETWGFQKYAVIDNDRIRKHYTEIIGKIRNSQ